MPYDLFEILSSYSEMTMNLKHFYLKKPVILRIEHCK